MDITDTEALKAHQKGVELIVSMGNDIPARIEGDPIRLKQVLRNLTNNAIKFTEKGEVDIEIEKTKENNQIVYLQFSVSDTGIGLSPQQIETLFTPFQQADISTTRKYGGSGLGLAISKRIVDLMNGKIWVKSEVGKGSTFSFEIPFKKATPRKGTDLFASKEVIGKKVLVVDSNIKSFQWLARLLKPTQAEVTHIADINTLEELLDLKEKGLTFDAVLVNNNVKGFRRLEDLIGIKNKFRSKDIKVIHLTDTVQFAQRIQESGTKSIDSVLIKPINASQLYDTWISLFSSKKTAMKSDKLGIGEKQKEQSFEGVKILLVEDNEINQEVIKELLDQREAQIVIAENGKIALDLLKKGKFDLILMDIQMPVMDGFTTAREIRKMKKYATLPIIALTANAQAEEKTMAEQAGMDDYITKPIEPRVLFNEIAKWTNRISQSKEVSSIEKEEQHLNVRGVDMEKGLARLNNNRLSYLQLLQKLATSHRDDPQKIEGFINNKDWVSAKSVAHSIKGAAANLEADHLVKSLERLEKLIEKQDSSAALKELKQTRITLNELAIDVQALQIEPKAAARGKTGTPVDKKKLLSNLRRLQRKIGDNDPEAKTMIQEILQQVPANQYGGRLTIVKTSLDLYDFEKAKDDLKVLIEMIKVEIKNG